MDKYSADEIGEKIGGCLGIVLILGGKATIFLAALYIVLHCVFKVW